MNSTVIIGCGHLGIQTYHQWPSHFKIHAVTRNPRWDLGTPFIWHEINLDQNIDLATHKEIYKSIKQTSWINFWLPPSSSIHYLKILDNLLFYLRSDQLLTFTSSTSVFGNQSQFIEENTATQPESENAKILVEAEKIIQKQHSLFHIIRLAGLVDEIRHPIYKLCQKKSLNIDGNQTVNLVHTQDAVGFMWHLANHHQFKKRCIITNLASHTHLTKDIFYKRSATKRKLPIPDCFDPDKTNIHQRLVSSENLWKKYGYQLKYLHLD